MQAGKILPVFFRTENREAEKECKAGYQHGHETHDDHYTSSVSFPFCAADRASRRALFSVRKSRINIGEKYQAKPERSAQCRTE
ncbi:MAG: hypothetical protein R2941_24435 [Desulfobacterales bacterium]